MAVSEKSEWEGLSKEEFLAKSAELRAQKKAAAEAAVRAGVVVPFPLKLTWERLMNARHKSSLKTAPFTFQGLQAAQEEGK
jgi:hypothetical protein